MFPTFEFFSKDDDYLQLWIFSKDDESLQLWMMLEV